MLGKCHLWILLPQLIAVTLAMTKTSCSWLNFKWAKSNLVVFKQEQTFIKKMQTPSKPSASWAFRNLKCCWNTAWWGNWKKTNQVNINFNPPLSEQMCNIKWKHFRRILYNSIINVAQMEIHVRENRLKVHCFSLKKIPPRQFNYLYFGEIKNLRYVQTFTCCTW